MDRSVPVKFHHLAYLVMDTTRSVESLRLFFPKVTLLRKPHDLQGVYITYMSTADGKMTIELVEPFENNKLLWNQLHREKRACLPYHICLSVDSFEAEYNRMRRLGWIPITRPFEASIGTKGSHLYKPAGGIIEIVGIN